MTWSGVSAQYNKFIMIDRIFFAADNQTPNPYGHMATEYDVASNTFRDLSAGITSNSWCSAVRPRLPACLQPTADERRRARKLASACAAA